MAKRRKEKKGKAKSLIVLLIFIIIAGGAFLGYRILKDRENEETSSGDGIIFNSKKEDAISTALCGWVKAWSPFLPFSLFLQSYKNKSCTIAALAVEI